MSRSDDLAIARARDCSRGCFVNGVRLMFGHKVSHSNIKNKRVFKQNMGYKTMYSEIIGSQRLRLSRRGQRTIEKYGGLDGFLKNYKKRKMTFDALNLKKHLELFEKFSQEEVSEETKESQ